MNEKKLLSSFELDKKIYFFVSGINLNIEAYYIYKGDSRFYKVEEEIDLNITNEVIKQLNKKKYSKVGDIKYKGEKYFGLLNNFLNTFIFYKNNNGKYIKCSYDDYSGLYNYYNSGPEILYAVDVNEQTNNEVKRQVKSKKIQVVIGELIVIVSLTLSGCSMFGSSDTVTTVNETTEPNISTATSSNVDAEIDKMVQDMLSQMPEEDNVSVYLDDTQNIAYSSNTIKIINSIEGNNNISDEEKEFFKSFAPAIEKNIDVIDVNVLSDRLNTISVNYEYNENENINGYKIGGEYSVVDNLITMYNGKDFMESV